MKLRIRYIGALAMLIAFTWIGRARGIGWPCMLSTVKGALHIFVPVVAGAD